MMQMSAIFRSQELDLTKLQRVLDLDPQSGQGRVDWLSLEEAFAARTVKLVDGRPSFYRNGDNEGLTR